jgi:hypothetical protein
MSNINEVRKQILFSVMEERIRQIDLPGSEWDLKNTPNDWIAIASHYLSEATRRNGVVPNKDDFQESLTKSAAVILAALENINTLVENNHLK